MHTVSYTHLDVYKRQGFDSVFEVAKAAELVSDATRRLLQTGSMNRPVISSACPAVTRLIRVRFPELIDHVLPLVAPIELEMCIRDSLSAQPHRW